MDTSTTSQDIISLLRQHYPTLTEPKLLEEIQREGTLMEFKAGETIMHTGSYVKLMPLIISGSIKVMREDEQGHELLLYYLKPGQTCSMSFTCCMANKKSEISTLAEEDTLLIAIPIRHLDDWMNRFQSWKNFVMATYDDRLMELVHTIDNIAFKRLDERLEEYLERKCDANESRIIHATHQEVALELNASREAISRLLKKMEREGRLKLGRNLIEFLG